MSFNGTWIARASLKFVFLQYRLRTLVDANDSVLGRSSGDIGFSVVSITNRWPSIETESVLPVGAQCPEPLINPQRPYLISAKLLSGSNDQLPERSWASGKNNSFQLSGFDFTDPME